MKPPPPEASRTHPDAFVFALVAFGVLSAAGVALLFIGRCFPDF